MDRYVLVFLAFLLIGCASDELHINSNTSWSCAINNTTVDGTGDRVIEVDRDKHPCYVCQKQTEEGYLELTCGNCEEGRTTAAYGLVSGCFSSGGF